MLTILYYIAWFKFNDGYDINALIWALIALGLSDVLFIRILVLIYNI